MAIVPSNHSPMEQEAFSYFIQAYTRLKDLNGPYRDNFDKYDEYYRGYRHDNRYPFAYNYAYNKIVPTVYTMLSRFMSHLYRNDEFVVVKARKKQDINRADMAAGVLNYQLQNMNSVDYQGGAYMLMLQWFLSALIYGKGIMRVYWRKEERIMPRRIDLQVPQIQMGEDGLPFIAGMEHREMIREAPQIVYDGPYMENIPVRQFLPDPEYRSIQKMPAVGHIYTKSYDWLRKMEQIGEYHNVELIGKTLTHVRGGSVDVKELTQIFKDIEDAHTFEEIETDRHSADNIDIVDMYGRYSLEGPTIDVDNGMTFKGPEEEVVCTIANYDTVIKFDEVKYGVRPFFDIGAHINPHRYYDIGVIELVADIQEAYNNLANLRLHDAMMKVNTMIKVDMNSDIDPRALVWKPFGIIPVEDMNEVEIMQQPDFNHGIYTEQMQFLEEIIQDATGVYDYSKGVTPGRAEYVGTMVSIQSVAESRIRILLMTMDYMGIRPLLRYMMLLNVYNLPSGYEYRLMGQNEQPAFGRVFGSDLSVDMDFEAKYAAAEPALAKQSRINMLLQYAQMWQQDPTVNQYEFKKAVLELHDMIDPDRYLKDPQQVQMEQEQAYVKQMLPQLGQAKLQQQMQREKNQTEIIKALMK